MQLKSQTYKEQQMQIDTSLITGINPNAFSQGVLTGQRTAQALQMGPIEVEAARLKNASASQQNAQNQLQLEENQRKAAFEQWDHAHELTTDPVTGEIDIQKYLTAATQAGHGKYAREAVAELTRVKSGLTGEASGQRAQIQKILIDTANGMQGMPQSQRDATKEAVRQDIVNRFKVDVNTSFGPNWDQSMVGAQYTPQSYQQKETQYATTEGRDPSSQTSISMRAQLNSMGAQIPDNISAFEIYNNPAYQTLVDQIATGTRVEAVKSIASGEQQKALIGNLLNRIDVLSKTNMVKPVESLKAAILRLGNTPAAAQLTAVVNDLAKLGIVVDEKTNLAGARDSLSGMMGSIESGQAGQAAIAGARTIPAAISEKPLGQTKQPSAQKMFTLIDKKSGKMTQITAAQADAVRAHKNASNFDIK